MIRKFQHPEIELEYLLTGEENKEAIMFVHGVGSNLNQFNAQHEYFSENYKVLSISLRGHGNSSPARKSEPSEYTLKKNRNDILHLLEYLKIDQVHFVGNSAGGLIGYELFLLKPKLFASLVTFGTTAELKLPDFTVNVLSRVDRLMLKYNPKGYAKFLGKHSSEYSHVQKELFRIFSSMGKGILMRQHIGNYSYISVLEKMDVPYLFIHSRGR